MLRPVLEWVLNFEEEAKRWRLKAKAGDMEAEFEHRVIEHSASLESRDNPFLPGGELSKEAEDLLSRATIIRDNFYLNEEEKRVLLEQQRQEEEKLQQEQQLQKKVTKHVQIVTHQDGDVSSGQPQAVDERVCVAASANSVSAMPTTSNGDGGAHLENGRRAGESGAPSTGTADISVTIPVSDGTAQASSTLQPDGADGLNSQLGPGPDGLNSDKKKPRNKCCSLM